MSLIFFKVTDMSSMCNTHAEVTRVKKARAVSVGAPCHKKSLLTAFFPHIFAGNKNLTDIKERWKASSLVYIIERH